VGPLIKGVVLDLDDTLYLERDYVRSGFSHVSAHLEERGVASAVEIVDFLWSGFEGGQRGHAFDSLVERWPQISEVEKVEALVDRYRQHLPSIDLLEPLALAELLDRHLVVGLISDGWPSAQRAKLKALGIEDSFSPVVLTGEWDVGYGKPHHRAFITIERASSLSGPELVYVADNPSKDFIGPNQRGWLSWRIRMPGQLHEGLEPEDSASAPTLELASLQDVAMASQSY
jgi:putative hydrolase of the HAD superfamily